ncbi:ArnT family glycosyltransferase [Marinobacter sp. 1Y8]
MFKRVNPWLWLLAAVLLSRLISMALFPLVDTTEPRYAEIARLMATTGDWITPWFSPGVPFWGKPPLSFWAQAAAIKAFGTSEFALRLPSWLCTLAMLWLTGWYAKVVYGAQVARWSAIILATMALTFISAGAVMTDPFLALGTTLSLVSFGMVIAGHQRYWRWLFFAGLAIGLLAKGPLALVLSGTPIALWLLWPAWRGNWKQKLGAFPWIAGTLATLAISLPWYIAAELKTPGFLDYFIIGEHIKRFIDPGWAGDLYGSAHLRPKGMIWVFWLWASFPWGILAIGGMAYRLLMRKTGPTTVALKQDSQAGLILLSALTPMLFFSLASNILWTYVLPSLPFSAILIARGLCALRLNRPRLAQRVSIPLALSVPLLTTAFALVTVASNHPLKTEETLAQDYETLKAPGDSALLYLDELPFSAQFYSKGTAAGVSMTELTKMRDEQRYRRYFVAIPKDQKDRILSQLPASTVVEASNLRYLLLSIRNMTQTQEG